VRRDPSSVGCARRPEDRALILAALTRLRQLACATRLVDPDAAAASTKLDRLVEMLRDLKAEGHRALVFSQFTTLLDQAREALEAAGIRSSRSTGARGCRSGWSRSTRSSAGTATRS
jgi:SNF2 family DNA or RNA helicase